MGIHEAPEGASSPPWRIALYTDSRKIAERPRMLDELRDQFGLDTVIFGGNVDLSPRTRALNPVAGSSATRGPGIALGDDSTIRAAIEHAHARGMQAWYVGGSYHGGAELAPDYMAVDLNGRRMDQYPAPRWTLEFHTQVWCPSHPRTHDWFRAAYAEIAEKYAFDASALTHVRYWQAGIFIGLLSCGCTHCQRRAADLGFDFGAMKHGVLEVIRALRELPTSTLRYAAQAPFHGTDLLHLLTPDPSGFLAWLTFRCRVIADNLADFRQAVHDAAKRDFAFGCDGHVPTFAPLVGQSYPLLARSVDQLLPLLSHLAWHHLQQFASLAQIILDHHPDVSEHEALQIAYRVFGFDHFDLPNTIVGLGTEDIPAGEARIHAVDEIIKAELAKARTLGGSLVPMYPVIMGSVWSEPAIRAVTAEARRLGYPGLVFQRTEHLGNWVR